MPIFGGKKNVKTKDNVDKQEARPAKKEALLIKNDYFYTLLKKPRLSEKALNLSSLSNKYVFDILKNANKSEIKKAVEKIFNVKVDKVNILVKPHKRKNLRGIKGLKGGTKKAIVTLKKGYKINIYPEQK